MNSLETINDAVQSVISQTYSDIEYILIDGGSSDGTINYLSSLDRDKFPHSLKIILQNDRGIYYGLNSGIDIASGDYIGFLHSDDLYSNEKVISNIVDMLKKSDADAIYGDLVYVDRSNVEIINRYWKSGHFTYGKLQRGWLPPHPTLFLKSNIYKTYGNFDVRFKIAADYDYILRVFTKGITVQYIPEVIYHMRAGGISNRSIKTIIQKSKEDLIAMKKNNMGGFATLLLKNLSKLPQLLLRET